MARTIGLLIHGCFLARAHLAAGDIDTAHGAAHHAWARLENVRSLRGRAQFVQICEELVRQQPAAGVAAFLDELDAALSEYDQLAHPLSP